MSAPEQNAPPAPVTTTTRSSRRRATSENVSCSSCHMRPLPAFLRSGRFSVTVTTPPVALDDDGLGAHGDTLPTGTSRPPGRDAVTAESTPAAPGVRRRPGAPRPPGPRRPRPSPRPRRSGCGRNAPHRGGHCGSHDPASRRTRRCLAGVTASKGEPKQCRGPGLHLAEHEDSLVGAVRHDVELTLGAAPIAIDDLVRRARGTTPRRHPRPARPGRRAGHRRTSQLSRSGSRSTFTSRKVSTRT